MEAKPQDLLPVGGGPGEFSPDLKARLQGADGVHPDVSLKAQTRKPLSKGGGRRRSWLKAGSELALPLPFRSAWTLNGLGDDPPLPPGTGKGNLLNQVEFVSLLYTPLPPAPRNTAPAALGASLSPTNMTHRINHHSVEDGSRRSLRR